MISSFSLALQILDINHKIELNKRIMTLKIFDSDSNILLGIITKDPT